VWVLPSRLILFDLTFSLVPVPLFLLSSIAFKVSALVRELNIFKIFQIIGQP
jgi:hypothetical protein